MRDPRSTPVAEFDVRAVPSGTHSPEVELGGLGDRGEMAGREAAHLEGIVGAIASASPVMRSCTAGGRT
jgi:hypothetical protein